MNVVKYILAILLLLTSLGTIMDGDFLIFLILVSLGLLLLPPISDLLKQKFKVWQNKVLRYITYIVLLFCSVVFILISSGGIGKTKSSVIVDFRSKKNILIKYIKNDTVDKSLQNLKKLEDIGKLFNNGNYSTINPHDGYISDEIHSINKKKFLLFNPRYDLKDAKTYLKNDPKRGVITDYIMNFEIDNNGNIISKETIITYSKGGSVKYKNDDVPELKKLINEEKINSIKQTIAIEKQILKQKEEHDKRIVEFEEKCLSSWDGSHRELVKYVKKNMHNPKSFEHVETRYGITGNNAGLVMIYRGTNSFGATVTNSIKAKVSLEDCSLISVED